MFIPSFVTTVLRQWVITLIAVGTLASCSNEDMSLDYDTSSRKIAFIVDFKDYPISRVEENNTHGDKNVTVNRLNGCDSLYLHTIVSQQDAFQQQVSRAKPVEDMSEYGSFGVLAYVYKGNWESEKGAYMDNIEVKESGDYWTPVAEYRWPLAEDNIRFFAYAPYKASGIILSGEDAVGTPVMRYEVPIDATKQRDVVATCTEGMKGGAGHQPASLTFKHVLTSIKFVSGDDMLPGTITRISLKGVHNSGNYTFESNSWDLDESMGDFNYKLSKKMDGKPDAEITPSEATFMMLPQTLPDGAIIEVEFADHLSNVKQILSASIAGTQWVAGNAVEYRISTSSVVITPLFNVTPPEDFIYTGGSSTYYVDSRVDISTTNEEPLKNIPVKWTAQFSTDEGETWTDVKPDWLTVFASKGEGNNGTDPEECLISVAAQKGVVSNLHNEKLRETPSLTYTYDLSTKGGTTPINTANCYIVNAPGTYTLPLIYGNAIKNGENNVSAYTSQSTGSNTNVLKTFVNHLDAEITSPYIYENSGCTPNKACLIWQDVPGIIKDVKLSANRHAISFKVSSENIMQGNAVIAVLDNENRIMWSWHIWITDYILGSDIDEITNYQGYNFSLLPYSIGWCDSEHINYGGRELQIKFTQEGTDEKQVITIRQLPEQLTNCSNQTYFQWGRKDPMLGGNIITGTNKMVDKQCYTENSEYRYTPVTHNSTIGNAIQTPYAQYCTGANWSKTNYRNLWSADNNQINANSTSPVKTIYDPSPVGFCVPPPQAFTGFTKSGTTASSSDLMNVTGTYDWGWNFYCNQAPDDNSPTTYFAASGYRALSDGTIKALGVRGYAWTAGPINTSLSWSLFYTESAVYPLYNDFPKSYSFPIRPCREN